METITKPFMTGRSQAVRIPKEYRYKENEELYVNKVGETLILTPKNSLRDSFMNSFDMFTKDFMQEGRPEEVSNPDRIGETAI